MSVPGEHVKFWGNGAWSGSASGKLKTPRAGVCVSNQNGTRYLIYSFFVDATPSAMARTFQSMRCQTAMHLDMNSAMQGYLGLISGGPEDLKLEAPHSDMVGSTYNAVQTVQGVNVTLPRYVGRPDIPDFFYIYKKN